MHKPCTPYAYSLHEPCTPYACSLHEPCTPHPHPSLLTYLPVCLPHTAGVARTPNVTISGPLMNYFGQDPQINFWRGGWTAPPHGSGRGGIAPRGRLRRRSSYGAESARWLGSPPSRCAHPFELPPTRQPMVDVRVIRTRTSDRGHSTGTTSAFISHLPSHLSPSLLQELVNWSLPPSRS